MNQQMKKLKEICIIKPPKNEVRKKLKDDDLVSFVPMEDLGILSKNINLNKERKLKEVVHSYTYFADDDVLLAKITPCFENGKLGIARNLKNGVGFGSSEYIVFRPTRDLFSEFLFYFLSDENFRKKGKKTMSGAVGHKRISKEFIENYQILLPPLSEQHRIVKILDEVFADVAKAKENVEKNFQNAKELFESYLQSVFANPRKDWEEKRLGEVCELKSGTTISPSLERKSGDVLYTKIADMNLPENFIEIKNSSRFVNSDEIKKNQIIPEGAIIFPKRGGAIATNKKRKIVKPTIVDLNTMAIIPSNKIDDEYFYHWFKLIDLSKISNGTSIPQINNYSFDEVYIPYPVSLKEQKSIVAKLDALSAEIKKLEAIYKQKLADLEELNKSMLKKAFNGEL
ncbi:restriction endonuclease subunit S [Candidatus Peregrinibacteria bacterium]|nr:restriction endonuclease subunit S [Candidatus Peregrinibacteria bacterium]